MWDMLDCVGDDDGLFGFRIYELDNSAEEKRGGGLEDGMQMHAFISVGGNELWDGL